MATTAAKVVAQAFYDNDPIPVFYPEYLKNEYRLVYILKNNIIISIERVEETELKEDFLKIEVEAEDGFSEIIAKSVSPYTLDVIGNKLESDEKTKLYKQKYNYIINGEDGKRVAVIDTKKSWNTKINHKLKNGTSIQTCFMALDKPRDYEKQVMITTAYDSEVPIIIKPLSGSSIYIKTEKSNKKEVKDRLTNNIDPFDAIEITKENQKAREESESSSQRNTDQEKQVNQLSVSTNKIVLQKQASKSDTKK